MVSIDLFTHDWFVASLKMSCSVLLCVSLKLSNTLVFLVILNNELLDFGISLKQV